MEDRVGSLRRLGLMLSLAAAYGYNSDFAERHRKGGRCRIEDKSRPKGWRDKKRKIKALQNKARARMRAA